MAEFETTDVLICGCGPTGAMLSGFLGWMNVPNIVLEKESGITTDPRGIVLDDDGIRLLQALGLYEHVFSEIGICIPRVQFVAGVHHNLYKKPIMCYDTSSTAGNTGHIGLLGHKQPVLEHHLRTAIDVAQSSELRSSCTLTSIREDSDWVYATYVNESGQEKQIRARFLVGADGKTGFTRKNYLEPRGIQMEWAESTRYQETWIALNWKVNPPQPATHPSFPLWKLGYSPEEVYDLFFPEQFRFLCNPLRPAVCGRFGMPSDRLWRFEFVVANDEDESEMAKPEMVQNVVFPYLRHPGSRYGLPEDVEYPQDCIEVLRCRPFRFSARSCNRWALGRVILCGDAAHVFPPFGGQGIASGFRDAVALSWRLVIACKAGVTNYEKLLEGWYLERKQQLDKSLASTVRNGDMVNTRNPLNVFLRDWGLWFLQLIPIWKRRLELGPKADGPVKYEYSQGMGFIAELGGGKSFAQTYCIKVQKETSQGLVQFTDDIIFARTKKKLFQIVVLLSDLDELPAFHRDLDGLDRICSHLAPEEATFFVHRRSIRDHPPKGQTLGDRVFRTASAEEFSESPLCAGRPAPRGYREDDLWQSMEHKRYAIVRFDRFIFAACGTRQELERAAKSMTDVFPQ